MAQAHDLPGEERPPGNRWANREPKDRTKARAFAQIANRARARRRTSLDDLADDVRDFLNRNRAPGQPKRRYDRTQANRALKAEHATWDDPELVAGWCEALPLDDEQAAALFEAVDLLPPTDWDRAYEVLALILQRRDAPKTVASDQRGRDKAI
jgi:hypothetical protein